MMSFMRMQPAAVGSALTVAALALGLATQGAPGRAQDGGSTAAGVAQVLLQGSATHFHNPEDYKALAYQRMDCASAASCGSRLVGAQAQPT
jgi:hypothetical protein